MDELYAFLFGGLFILLMLFVFFGGASYGPVTNDTNGADNVTFPDELKWRDINLGDIEISEQELTKKETITQDYEIFNGLFFGKKIYKAQYEADEEILSNLESASFTYSIKDTNRYGEMEVRFNNETLNSGDLMIGNYKHDVEPDKRNVIEMETSSSGWKIWAPSTYIISNVSMNLNYNLKDYPEHEFFVSDYIHKNLKKSEMLFRFGGGSDELEIELNNKTFYKEMPHSGTNSVEVLNIKEGENKITFSSEGEVELQEVKVRLHYYK